MMKGAKTSPPPTEPAAEPASLTPGMAALLRRGNGGPKPEDQPQEPPPPPAAPERPRGRHWLRTSLWLADVLLLGLAVRLVFQPGGSFGFIEAALCVVAVLLGVFVLVPVEVLLGVLVGGWGVAVGVVVEVPHG